MNRYQALAMRDRFVTARRRRIASEVPYYRQEERLHRMVVDWSSIYAELREVES
jgi:hypothetical protein